MANELSESFPVKVTLYAWKSNDMVFWGSWNRKIKIRMVPYSRYYQKLIGQIYYFIWSKIDNPDTYLINFIYHGETTISKKSKLFYVLHSPASLIPSRYKFIKDKYKIYQNLNFISVSDFVKNQSMSFIYDSTNFVIHHGIDFEKIVVKKKYKQKNKIKLLTVAALESWKGIQAVIAAFSEQSIKNNYEYFVIGEGPYRSKLKRLIKKYNAENSIFLLGQKDNVESLYCNYDIYCHLSEGEAFGLAIVEAMGAGLPAILNDTQPFDILFNDSSVLKVSTNKTHELINALLRLKSAEYRQEIGEGGRGYVRNNFNIKKMAENYFGTLFNYEN